MEDTPPLPPASADGKNAAAVIAKNWPRYHRRLYLRAEPSLFISGVLLAVPGALLTFGNPSVLRLFPTFSEAIVLDSLAVAVAAKVVAALFLAPAYRMLTTARRIGAASETSTDVSFVARSMDEQVPGFSAVWQVFDQIVPGMTREVKRYRTRSCLIGGRILAGFLAAVCALVLADLFHI
jgi:hypothetical protein